MPIVYPRFNDSRVLAPPQWPWLQYCNTWAYAALTLLHQVPRLQTAPLQTSQAKHTQVSSHVSLGFPTRQTACIYNEQFGIQNLFPEYSHWSFIDRRVANEMLSPYCLSAPYFISGIRAYVATHELATSKTPSTNCWYIQSIICHCHMAVFSKNMRVNCSCKHDVVMWSTLYMQCNCRCKHDVVMWSPLYMHCNCRCKHDVVVWSLLSYGGQFAYLSTIFSFIQANDKHANWRFFTVRKWPLHKKMNP